jgi:hypothetical protein
VIFWNASADFRASYTSPRSSDEALMIADENLEYRSATKDGTLNTEAPKTKNRLTSLLQS